MFATPKEATLAGVADKLYISGDPGIVPWQHQTLPSGLYTVLTRLHAHKRRRIGSADPPPWSDLSEDGDDGRSFGRFDAGATRSALRARRCSGKCWPVSDNGRVGVTASSARAREFSLPSTGWVVARKRKKIVGDTA